MDFIIADNKFPVIDKAFASRTPRFSDDHLLAYSGVLLNADSLPQLHIIIHAQFSHRHEKTNVTDIKE
jgi:hypothetical protein